MCKYSKLKDCESWWIWNCRCFSIEYNCNCRKELVPWCNRTVDNLKNGWISQEQLFSIIENSLQAILDGGKWRCFPSFVIWQILLKKIHLNSRGSPYSSFPTYFCAWRWKNCHLVQFFLLFLFKSLKCLPTEIQPDTEYFILKHSHFCQEEYLKPFLSIKNTFAKENLKILMILLPRYS